MNKPSKWSKDFNVSCDTTRLLEEKIGGMLFDISLRNIFLDLDPQARASLVTQLIKNLPTMLETLV